MKSALEVQEGGSHYKSLPYQPVELAHKLNLTFMEGSAIKYITRYKSKDGLKDLKKCRHFIQLIKQLVYDPSERPLLLQLPKEDHDEWHRYCDMNSLTIRQSQIISFILSAKWDQGLRDLDHAEDLVIQLIKEEYGVDA